MSAGGIEEPYTIASLPRPLDAEHGRTHSGVVHSLSGSRKRKRHEIAVAVDGESVNIYNVQTQATASSYALPPQSYLAAAPCSIYCKRAKPLHPQRHTYLAVRNGSNEKNTRLVAISEDLGKPQNDDTESRTPTKRERKLRGAQVLSLDTIPSAGIQNSTPSLVVSYHNGNVDCISGDLSQTRWEHTVEDQLDVEHSVVTDSDAARKGLLRGRQDVLALLNPEAPGLVGDTTTPLLCQIVRFQEKREVRIYVLRNVGTTVLQSQRSGLEQILKYDLPGTSAQGNLQYDLHVGSGLLYQRIQHRLAVYDLSGTIPRISFDFGNRGPQSTNSFARLSNAAIVTVSHTRVSVYDMKFGSTLKYLSLAETGERDSNPSPRLLSHFSDLGIIAALWGNNLVAFQLGEALDETRRSKGQGPLLSEVLGKGKFSADHIDEVELKEKKRIKWKAWVAKVDHVVQHEDSEGLEKLVAHDIGLFQKLDMKTEESKGLTNGNGYAHSAPEKIWNLLPQHYDPQHVERKKAVYVLGKIFSWRSISSGFVLGEKHLQVNLKSRNVLRWLALAGYLTAAELEHALPKASKEFDSKPYVAPGDIMRAIGDSDIGFELLCDLISLPIFWDLSEVLQVVNTLVKSLEDKTDADTQYLITNGDITMTDEKSEAQVKAEEAAAMWEIEQATKLFEAGLQHRSITFRKCLDRLQEFSNKDVSQAMRALMSQDELVFFIQIMRVELANGGWTFTYDSEGEGKREISSDFARNSQELYLSNQAIRAIAHLISCAVDGIGLSGWLVGLSGDSFVTDDILKGLVKETSAIIQSIFAADNIEVALREVEKTAASAHNQQLSLKRKRTDVETAPEQVSEQTLLPLGGRLEPPVVGKAAEGKKSKMYFADQKSRTIGKYSLERIRI